MQPVIKLLSFEVDTLILNVRYADKQFQPVKQELAADLARELDYLQTEARKAEIAVASDWVFNGALLFCQITWGWPPMAMAAHILVYYPGRLTWSL